MDQRGGGDRIYEMMEERGGEGDVGKHLQDRDDKKTKSEKLKKEQFSGPDAEDRKPRSKDEMRAEAEMLRLELERDGIFTTPPAPTSMSTSTSNASDSTTSNH